jgi:hypothetical protein
MRNLLPILLSILTALLVLTSAPAYAIERVAVLEPTGSLDDAVLAKLSDQARAGVLDAVPKPALPSRPY